MKVLKNFSQFNMFLSNISYVSSKMLIIMVILKTRFGTNKLHIAYKSTEIIYNMRNLVRMQGNLKREGSSNELKKRTRNNLLRIIIMFPHSKLTLGRYLENIYRMSNRV